MSPWSKYWGDVSPCPIGIDAPGPVGCWYVVAWLTNQQRSQELKTCQPSVCLRIELYAPEFHATFFMSVFLSKLLVLVLVVIGFANTRKSIGNTNTNIYISNSIAILWQYWNRYWQYWVLQYDIAILTTLATTNIRTSLVGPQVSRLSLLSSVHSTLFVATAADFNDVRNDVIRSVSRSRELVNIDKVSTWL